MVVREKILENSVGACLALIAIVGVSAAWTPCHGQTGQSPNAETRTDTYGNARGVYSPRRAMGNFANDTQRLQLRGFQSEGRRALYRGGDTPFALPSDRILSNLAGRPLTRARSSAQYWQNKQAFAQYGILGTKRPIRASTDPASLYGRRAALLRATAGMAPVRQALILRGSTFPRVGSVLPGPATPSAGDSSLSPVTLGDALQLRLTDQAVSLQARGWANFDGGEYRRAVRAFESAAMLAPEEVEPQIAEIFCFLSMGAFHTAAVSLEQLARLDDMLFAGPIDIAAHYSEQAELLRIRIQCRSFSQSSQSVARGAAIYPFFLWYVGDRKEALKEAGVVAREHPNTVFAQWAVLMARASE